MTAPEQRDPVEALYQRVESARHAYRLAVDEAHGHEDPPLREALDALREATGDKGASVDSVMQAVARELVGTGEPGTEWVAFWGIGDDPNVDVPPLPLGMAGFIRSDDRGEAVAIAHNHRGRVAQRQVTVYRTPWQVVDTEGGDQS